MFYRKYFKRMLDVLVAGTALVVLSPVMAITAIVIVATMGRPVMFLQQRVGRYGKTFTIFKFRTMLVETMRNGRPLSNADRIPLVGRWLRKSSLDELPQLLNIVRGEMSIVGPRPLLVEYLPYYTPREQSRHSVLPGVTGLAQISGRNNLDWESRLELDAQYVERQGPLLDAWIIMMTVGKVLRGSDVEVAGPQAGKLSVYREQLLQKNAA